MRVLLDTSVWVDHLRRADDRVARVLDSGQAMIHPFVIGEIALGHLRSRARILGLLRSLPAARVATDDEVLHLIERRKLSGLGIGYVDAHLIASTLLGDGMLLWSRDRRLASVATSIGIGFAMS